MLLKDVKSALSQQFPELELAVELDEPRSIVTVGGECGSWQELVDVGHAAAAVPGVRSVVSDMTVKDTVLPKKDYSGIIEKGNAIGVIDSADVVIVGAGVTGCGIARELSRYDLKIVLIEKNDDVGSGATKANNGDIHSGYNEKPGTLKAKLNVRGNAMYSDWANDLNFDLHRDGNIVVISEERFMPQLKESYDNAIANGVEAYIVGKERALELEPSMTENGIDPVAALYIPSTAVVEPWQVAIALAENATVNGTKVMLGTTVGDVIHDGDEIRAVVTDKGIINTRYLINCAGVYADEISAMAGDRCFTIHPRRGTIAIIDNNVPPYIRNLRMFNSTHPTKNQGNSKGGGMATTIEQNNLLGPSAVEVPDKEDLETTEKDLAFAMSRNCKTDISYKNIIRFFSGSRPATFSEDFFIEMSPKIQGLLNVGGIQSPGLASAPAVAEMSIGLLMEQMDKLGEKPQLREDFQPHRDKPVQFRHLSREEQDELISRRPEYGRIVCRCETVTEGEIIDAIHSPVVPTSVDAIKRRVRAGMGRCQGGFCQIRVIELLARELGRDWVDINLNREGSNILLENNRG